MTNALNVEIVQDGFSWPGYEKTDEEYNLSKVKVWASQQIEYWIPAKKRYNGAKTYNVRQPIFVNVYWNKQPADELVQVVLTKDRILRKSIDFPYKLFNRLYLLILRSEFDKHQTCKRQKKSEPKAGTPPLNFAKVFNAVECSKLALPKYGTPVLYTGMTN